MSHMPASGGPSDAWGLPSDLIAMLDARAQTDGIGRTEALARCLREWRHHHDVARRRVAPPASEPEREYIPGNRAASDRTGTDARD